jgi:error-prone DNA polymerase
MSWVHLHTHSSYSPMEGVPSLDALCAAARQQGSHALALTDTNGLYGAIHFVTQARAAGLKPIIGAELLHHGRRAVALVRSSDGYSNLCRLLSAVHCDPDFDLLKQVADHRQGLIILSDDTEALQMWKRASRDDLYVELTPGNLMHQALAFSRASGLPPVATCRARFLRPEDYPLHRLLRAIALNTTLSRLGVDACTSEQHWLMPPERLARDFPHVPQALTNTTRIAEQCKTDWNFNEVIFPQFRQLPRPAACALLREKTYTGAAWRYGAITPAAHDRIERELSIIDQKGFADYFLVVAEIVEQAPRTCGRGSAAASIVSYCLGITHVDPIRHRLLFERFLNPGREDPPDIDIDFPWDERDRVLDWIMAKYGARSAAMVANHNMVGAKGALREVAKVYGMPEAEIKEVSAKVGRQAALVGSSPNPQAWVRRMTTALHLARPWPEILTAAVQIDEHFRNLSLHCGGIVIVPDEICRYVPIEISAKGLPVIQFEKEQAENSGLVKIDLLGNRSLAVIRDALAAIKQNTGRVIDYATWDPLTDPATQALICRGDTMGCFYIESPATRLLLKKLWGGMPAERKARADVYEYLTIVSSLIRPAANTFVDEFVRRAHGRPYAPLHPIFDELLAETHGIMVYQEDVMQVAMGLAGFSVHEADGLRKVLSKKDKVRRLMDYAAQFAMGCRARGIAEHVIRQSWEMILSFAGYSFCKPHSASYAQLSFKACWVRAHYPAEFMAAVISNEGGFYSPWAYLSEARRMGLSIERPDINASHWHYTGQGQVLQTGFMHLKGLEHSLITTLVTEREKHGPFRSWQEFFARVRPQTEQARLLIKGGCCESLAGELTRPALLWRLYAQRPAADSSASLFDQRAVIREAFPIPEEYSALQIRAHEYELFGFPLGQHPLDFYQEWIVRLRPVPSIDLMAHVGRAVRLVGVLVTEKMAETKAGEPMEFLTLEDQHGLYDVTVFPDQYRRYCHLLRSGTSYIVEGRVEASFGVVTVTLTHIARLSEEGVHDDAGTERNASDACESEDGAGLEMGWA